jgi:hypothetical protein
MEERTTEMKLLLAALLMTTAAFSQAVVKYEPITLNCANQGFFDALSSGCFLPQIKVTAHPADPNVIGFFILVVYRSAMFGVPIAQPHFTTTRDANGDFIATFPSGDMTGIVISAQPVSAGSLVLATPAP